MWRVWLQRDEDKGAPTDRSRDSTLCAPVGDLLANDTTWRCLVLDVGSPMRHEERSLTAAVVLSQLWRERDRIQRAGRPYLIVVDEAHNVCPGEPLNELERLSTDLMNLIAGEGRKFHLHLLVASQRPTKIHPNILTL
jgi:hypothetical protein